MNKKLSLLAEMDKVNRKELIAIRAAILELVAEYKNEGFDTVMFQHLHQDVSEKVGHDVWPTHLAAVVKQLANEKFINASPEGNLWI
jgi:hypothetical protein